jgi:hypothetical protein
MRKFLIAAIAVLLFVFQSQLAVAQAQPRYACFTASPTGNGMHVRIEWPGTPRHLKLFVRAGGARKIYLGPWPARWCEKQAAWQLNRRCAASNPVKKQFRNARCVAPVSTGTGTPGPSGPRCGSVLLTERRTNALMTLQSCKSGTPNIFLAQIFYGRPRPSGKPSGKLYFQAWVRRTSPRVSGPVVDWKQRPSCGPISYQVRMVTNSAGDVVVSGRRPERDTNCMLTGKSKVIRLTYRVSKPSGPGTGGGGGGTSTGGGGAGGGGGGGTGKKDPALLIFCLQQPASSFCK